MKTIHKYILDIQALQTIKMPEDPHILDIQVQDEDIVMWAKVDTEDKYVTHTFAIYGTGNPMPEYPGLYLATVQLDGFAWHIYEKN